MIETTQKLHIHANFEFHHNLDTCLFSRRQFAGEMLDEYDQS